MKISRELSLSNPWVRHHGAHLQLQATEDQQANGTCGTVPIPYPHPSGDPAPMFPDQEKQHLRARGRALRRDINNPAAGARIAEQGLVMVDALDLEPSQTIVAGYWPLDGEADVRPLLLNLHERGFSCSLPVVMASGRSLRFRSWRPGMDLVPGAHGCLQPGDRESEVVPNLLLAPLVAFDRQGGRLGMGGGYYDRTLETLRARGPVTAVGIAYAAQEVDRVPGMGHDQPLDWIVTEAWGLRIGAEAE